MTAHGTKAPGDSTAASALLEPLDGRDEVADGAHRAEVFRADLAANHPAHALDEIDGIDAVDLQVFTQSGGRHDPCRVDLEQLGKRRAQQLQYFFGAQHQTSIGRVRRAASVLFSRRLAWTLP